MPNIRPSSDLRNHYNEISEYCHTTGKPVFITKNGGGDLVVMSNDEYDKLSGKLELRRLLIEGLEEAKRIPGKPADEAFKEIAEEFGFE